MQILRAPGTGGALRLRLSDPAEARREAARRPGRARSRISPICTRGPKSICRARDGSAWIRPRACLRAKGTFRLRRRPEPASAAPVSGGVDECEVKFVHEMTRHADSRRSARHPAVHRRAMGRDRSAGPNRSTQDIRASDIRLTMGGEPTFVSIDDMDGAEWNIAALGPNKRKLARAAARPLARAASRPAGCCISGRANGIRASRCRAGL